MKNLLNEISQQEKNRILEMHKSYTKKHYLMEQPLDREKEVKEFHSDMSKILEEFGSLEAYLDSLPDDVKHLDITNEENLDLSLDVPENIGKFNNLISLSLNGFVNSLPDSIGNLNRLSFISFADNPNLTILPESIYDLPELDFLNIMGCGDIEIPEDLEERITILK